MKTKVLLSFMLLLFCAGTIFAQNTLKKSAALNTPVFNSKKAMLGNEVILPPQNVPEPSVTNRYEDINIGATWYDLQTNTTMADRLINHGDGTLSAVWTMSSDQGGFATRGTGYNHFDGTQWGPAPSGYLEADIRTGWPCISAMSDGTELVVNHIFAAPHTLHTITQDGSAWAEADIPSDAPGPLWPRAAIGGDGDDLHVIGITLPIANGGALYEGVDGHLLYFRSLDGGATFETTDMIIDGLTSEFYTSMFPDAYAIDARGDVIAFAIFADFGDVTLFKSLDNGDTWTKTIINDFPLDNYTLDDGYTVDDIGVDPFAPDTLAINTCDGSGAIIIDANDNVHVVYGNMYVQDVDLADEGYTFYPATYGLQYWNENLGPDGNVEIAAVSEGMDVVPDDSLAIATTDEIASYFVSLTSFPSLGLDENGIIHLAYSQVMENFYNEDQAQHYRHIMLTRSFDGGTSWDAPYDLINSNTIEEFHELNEAVFPSVARLVDDKVHLIFQRDYSPGLHVRGDMDEVTNNDIVYMGISSDWNTDNETLEEIDPWQLTLVPNPASDFVNVHYRLNEQANVSLQVFNIIGQQVFSTSAEIQPAGKHAVDLDLTNLSKGIYLIQINVNDEISTRKLVIE